MKVEPLTLRIYINASMESTLDQLSLDLESEGKYPAERKRLPSEEQQIVASLGYVTSIKTWSEPEAITHPL